MRIDESCINYNVARIIDEATVAPYDFSDQDDTLDHHRIMTIGYIRGVIDFAKELKKVLNE